jgi:hypothetical protein
LIELHCPLGDATGTTALTGIRCELQFCLRRLHGVYTFEELVFATQHRLFGSAAACAGRGASHVTPTVVSLNIKPPLELQQACGGGVINTDGLHGRPIGGA